MTMYQKFLAGAALAAALAVGGQASATSSIGTVYSDPGTLTGNQAWTYRLGQDFTVNSPVTIDYLGAFTNGGANTNVDVALYLLNDSNPANGGTLVASTVIAGNQHIIGDYSFQAIKPVTLAAGDYQLRSYGGPSDTNFNTFNNTDIINFNTLGGKLTQGADFYDPGAGTFATTADTHWYAAASLGVPEPATWAMMMLGLGGLGAALRMHRRTAGAASAVA